MCLLRKNDMGFFQSLKTTELRIEELKTALEGMV